MDKAEALVAAVDAAAKDHSRQLEVQANALLRKSELLRMLRGNKLGNYNTSHSFKGTFSPFPSEQKTRIHPAVKWDMRAQELTLVMATGRQRERERENSQTRTISLMHLCLSVWRRHPGQYPSPGRPAMVHHRCNLV
jgi:hypothetical protein